VGDDDDESDIRFCDGSKDVAMVANFWGDLAEISVRHLHELAFHNRLVYCNAAAMSILHPIGIW